MKNPMDDSRTLRSESGFALIEVIVAAAVLAIVALAVLSGIDAASSTSAREKARAVAASLAEQRPGAPARDDLRADPEGEAERRPAARRERRRCHLHTSSPRSTWSPTTSAARPRAVSRERQGTQVSYVHITSTVTSKVVGTNIAPVKVDSLIPPTQKWAEDHGSLGVKVVDRSGTQGVRNIAVTASSPGLHARRRRPPTPTAAPSSRTSRTGPTRSRSTARTTSIAAATQLSQTTATVVAKKVVFVTMSYDVADTVDVDVVTHPPGKTWNIGPRRGAAALEGAQGLDHQRRQRRHAAHGHSVDADDPGRRRRPVPVRRGPLRLLHRWLPVHVTRQGDPSQPRATATPLLYPTYFDAVGGVNPAAAVLADPAVMSQRATVRQPPFNIRVGPTRTPATPTPTATRAGAATWRSGRPCRGRPATRPTPAPRRVSGSSRWPGTVARFGSRTVGTGDDHWVSQPDGPFDPGMPFGTYTLCVRDTRTRPRRERHRRSTLRQHQPQRAIASAASTAPTSRRGRAAPATTRCHDRSSQLRTRHDAARGPGHDGDRPRSSHSRRSRSST